MKLPFPTHKNQPYEGRFWNYALVVYAQPGVSQACLKLQDEFGADIPLLLFAGWVGAVWNIFIAHDEAAHLQSLVAPWQVQVVKKLRTLRRDLKVNLHPVSSMEIELLRNSIKAAELQAEKMQMALLENYAFQNYIPAAAASCSAARLNVDVTFKLNHGFEMAPQAAEFLIVLVQAINTANDL